MGLEWEENTHESAPSQDQSPLHAAGASPHEMPRTGKVNVSIQRPLDRVNCPAPPAHRLHGPQPTSGPGHFGAKTPPSGYVGAAIAFAAASGNSTATKQPAGYR